MKTFFVCLVVVAAAMAAEQRDKRGLLAPAIATPWGAPLGAPLAAPIAAPGILTPRVAIGAPAIAASGILAPRLAIGAPAIGAPLLSRTIVSPWAGHSPLVW